MCGDEEKEQQEMQLKEKNINDWIERPESVIPATSIRYAWVE